MQFISIWPRVGGYRENVAGAVSDGRFSAGLPPTPCSGFSDVLSRTPHVCLCSYKKPKLNETRVRAIVCHERVSENCFRFVRSQTCA